MTVRAPRRGRSSNARSSAASSPARPTSDSSSGAGWPPRLEQAIAELDRLPAGLDPELGPQRPVQAVVLAERAVAVAGGHELPHQLQVRPLVARIDGDDVRPTAPAA